MEIKATGSDALQRIQLTKSDTSTYGKCLNEYSFEKVRPATRRSKKAAMSVLETFTKRLGFSLDQIPNSPDGSDMRDLLSEFVYDNHLPIAYYEDKRTEEIAKGEKFRKLSIGTIVAVPVGLVSAAAGLSSLPGGIAGADTAALITAGLTSLIGLQRAMGTWMNQRQLVGVFWKASAELKENIYTLERKWQDQKLDATRPDPRFIADLVSGLARAREILRAERDAYFATYDRTALDVGTILSSSKTQASGLWDAFAKGTLEQSKDRSEQFKLSRESAVDKRAKAQRLRKEIEKVETLLKQTIDDDAHKSARKSYLDRITKLRLDLATAEVAAAV